MLETRSPAHAENLPTTSQDTKRAPATNKVRKSILFVILAILTVNCSGTIAPSSSPTPESYTPVTVSMIDQDTAYLAVVEGVITVIHGIVEKKTSTATIASQGDQLGANYSDWSIKVIRYLIYPLPYDHITLRVVDEFILADDSKIGPRNPYRLTEDEEVILFLTKRGAVGTPLSEDGFTTYVVDGPTALTQVPVENGQVHVIREGRGVVESVDDFIARIQQYAREAGRKVQ